MREEVANAITVGSSAALADRGCNPEVKLSEQTPSSATDCFGECTSLDRLSPM